MIMPIVKATPEAIPATDRIKRRVKVRPRSVRAVPLFGAQAKHESAVELVRQVRKGVRFSRLRDVGEAMDLSREQLAEFVSVPVRTLARRERLGRLLPDESDRLLRGVRLIDLATRLFDGDKAEARAWMKRPRRALGGDSPLQFATTDAGAREIERLIGQLEHGVFT